MLPKKRTATKRRGRHPQRAFTDAFCRDVAEAGRYADGNGLYLHVDPTGARRWVQRLVVQGRSRTLGLGGYGLVSLARARVRTLANRRRARAGGDIETPAVRPRPADVPTFEEAAARVVDIYSGAWRPGGKTAAQWRGELPLELLVLTATRSAEVRLARWREVDPAARVWTIPVSRMEGEAGAPGAAERPVGRGAGRGGGATALGGAARAGCSRASAAGSSTARRSRGS